MIKLAIGDTDGTDATSKRTIKQTDIKMKQHKKTERTRTLLVSDLSQAKGPSALEAESFFLILHRRKGELAKRSRRG